MLLDRIKNKKFNVPIIYQIMVPIMLVLTLPAIYAVFIGDKNARKKIHASSEQSSEIYLNSFYNLLHEHTEKAYFVANDLAENSILKKAYLNRKENNNQNFDSLINKKIKKIEAFTKKENELLITFYNEAGEVEYISDKKIKKENCEKEVKLKEFAQQNRIISGIKLDKNQLKIAGLVPLWNDTIYIGSFEVTYKLQEITKHLLKQENNLLIFLKESTDSIKNPRIAKDKYIGSFHLVENLKKDSIKNISEQFLAQGLASTVYIHKDNQHIAATPLLNFNDSVIGVSVHVMDITKKSEEILQTRRTIIIASFVIFIILTSILLLLNFFIVVRPIKNIVRNIESIAKGELNIELSSSGSTELSELADKLNQMFEKFRMVLRTVRDSAENLSYASNQINSSAQNLSQGASEQAASVEEVSASMEEMTANIEQNMDNSVITERNVLKAGASVHNGNRSVKRTTEVINRIAEKITIINEIAKQTNILALNASVESAAAGHFGKGFSVIAIEIRRLAEFSRDAAFDIEDHARQGVINATKADTQLEQIVLQMEKTSELIKNITVASKEQNAGVSQITHGIQQLNKVTQQNAAVSEEMATNAEELSAQAELMKEQISFFSIDNEDELNGNLRFDPYANLEVEPAKIDKYTSLIAENTDHTETQPTNKDIGITIEMGNEQIEDDDFERF